MAKQPKQPKPTLQDAQKALELYNQAVHQRSALETAKKEAISSIIPAEMQARLDEVDEEFDAQLLTADSSIKKLAESVRALVAQLQKPVEDSTFRVSIVKGRTKADIPQIEKEVEKLKEAYPSIAPDLQRILDCIYTEDPSAKITIK